MQKEAPGHQLSIAVRHDPVAPGGPELWRVDPPWITKIDPDGSQSCKNGHKSAPGGPQGLDQGGFRGLHVLSYIPSTCPGSWGPVLPQDWAPRSVFQTFWSTRYASLDPEGTWNLLPWGFELQLDTNRPGLGTKVAQSAQQLCPGTLAPLHHYCTTFRAGSFGTSAVSQACRFGQDRHQLRSRYVPVDPERYAAGNK